MKLGARDYIVKDFDANFREVIGLSLTRVHAALLLESERRKLLHDMQILRVAIESSNDGLAAVSSRYGVLYQNRSFASFVRLCGGSPDSIQTLFSAKVNRWESLRDSLLLNMRSLAPGAFWHTEVTLVENKDVAFDLSLSAAGAGNGNDAEGEYVLWVRDISEQKRREKFQREILSTTTHDLKGPLGAIIISSELLIDMLKGQDRSAELALRVGSSARSAVNLIDEFLSARRIQEGTFVLKPQLVDLGLTVTEVIGDYETIAVSRGISLEYQAPLGVLEWRVDRLGFSRVLGNLLGNALKFTPRGGTVRVELGCVADELHLRVKDSGCGMEPSEVQKIFERFSRLEKHSGTAGTGLGLFVVKSIINAHGGKIEVTSQLDAGTTFDVVLPQKPPVNERGELISLDFA